MADAGRHARIGHGIWCGVFRHDAHSLAAGQADERAGLLSAFYVEGYLSFSLPAVLTGFLAPIVGLTIAANVYGVAVIVMALLSMLAMARSKAI